MKKTIYIIILIFFVFVLRLEAVNAKSIDYADTLLIESSSTSIPNIGFGTETFECATLVGPNFVKIIKLVMKAFLIIAVIVAIVNGMLTLVPAVISSDANALRKAGNKCVIMLVVLAVTGVFPTIIKVIGNLFNYDLTCLF